MRPTFTIATLALLAGACGGASPRTAAAPAGRADCSVLPAPTAAAESATVVLTWPVDATNAPHASNPAERFVFAHVYESFTPVDCLGRQLPSRRPGGAGPYRIRDDGTPRSPADATRHTTIHLEPVNATNAPRLTIHSISESDARDLIDAGVDLVLTDDPALSTYAATRSDVATVPLGFDRSWVLLTPPHGSLPGSSAPPADTVAARSLAFRGALARDAVRAEARGSQGPSWWTEMAACTTSPVAAALASPPKMGARIAYRRGDAIARGLAERLVALAGATGPGMRDSALALVAPALAVAGRRLTALALAPNDFTTAIRDGSELAFIVALPRRSLSPCTDADRLRASAPWLAAEIDAGRASGAMTALIDTRLLAVVRPDRLGLSLTWDSTLVVAERTLRAAGGTGVRR